MIHINGRRRNHHIAYYRGPPPGFDNPTAWFEFTDYPKPKGSITQEQILNSIYANLRPRNTTQRVFLRSRIQEKWIEWDPNHQMRLNKPEFMHCGILPFLSKLQLEFMDVFRPKNSKAPAKAAGRRKSIGRPPPLSKERRWFDHYDTNSDGLLTEEEVTMGLFQTFKLKSDKEKDVIRDTIERAWPTFDDDYSGNIDKWEFCVKGGLHDYLILLEQEWNERPQDRTSYHFLNLYVNGTRRHSYVPPPQLANSEAWFMHFDFDHSGKLSEKETINGLYATLNANTSQQRQSIRKIVTSAWNDYGDDNDEHISLHDFSKEEGLAEMFEGYQEYWKSSIKTIEEETCMKEHVVTKIKVQIPKGKEPGDVLKVSSPKTQEMVVLLIPDKIVWGGGTDEPYYFTVKF